MFSLRRITLDGVEYVLDTAKLTTLSKLIEQNDVVKIVRVSISEGLQVWQAGRWPNWTMYLHKEGVSKTPIAVKIVKAREVGDVDG